MILAMLLATNAPAASKAEVPARLEAAWTACRNEKFTYSMTQEMVGCEKLIASNDVGNKIKAVAHANRGMLLSFSAFKMSAKDELDKAIALDPQLAPAYYNRGLLADSAGDGAAALVDYSKAISLDPKMVEAIINRGIVYAKTGALADALKDFDQAILLEPESPDLYENRAALLNEMGRSDDAAKDLAKAKALPPRPAAPSFPSL